MPDLTVGAICAHDKLEPRRRRAVGESQHHAAILIPLCPFHPFVPHEFVLWNPSQKHFPDGPAIDLWGIAAFAKLKDLFAVMVVEQMDRGVPRARVLLELLKDASLSHGALTTARVQIQAPSAWRNVPLAAFVDDIVQALAL